MTGYKSTAGRNTFYQTELRPVYSPDLQVWIATRQHSAVTKEAAVEGDVTPPQGWKFLKTGGKITSKSEISGDFDIVTCDESMAKRLNEPANRRVRDELRLWGKDARLITTVAIAFNHNQNKEGHLSGETVATYNAAAAKLSVKQDSKHTSRLSDGTVFAYEMSRIAWQLGPDAEPEIAALIPDYLGINRLKRPGTVWDPSQLKP
jgi:hypothetical protein